MNQSLTMNPTKSDAATQRVGPVPVLSLLWVWGGV